MKVLIAALILGTVILLLAQAKQCGETHSGPTIGGVFKIAGC